jgi:hypothetical protein
MTNVVADRLRVNILKVASWLASAMLRGDELVDLELPDDPNVQSTRRDLAATARRGGSGMLVATQGRQHRSSSTTHSRIGSRLEAARLRHAQLRPTRRPTLDPTLRPTLRPTLDPTLPQARALAPNLDPPPRSPLLCLAHVVPKLVLFNLNPRHVRLLPPLCSRRSSCPARSTSRVLHVPCPLFT